MTRVKVRKLVLTLMFATFFPFNQFGYADWSFVRKLDDKLSGVQIVRLHSPTTNEDQEHLKKVHKLCFEVFYERFVPIYHKFTPPMKDLEEAKSYCNRICQEEIDDLAKVNNKNSFYFLEALDEENQAPLGLATFVIDSKTEIYLSTFATTYFREPGQRGIGKQLLGSIFKFFPHVEKVNLLVRPQNEESMKVYNHFGFESKGYTRSGYKEETFLGLTLESTNLQKFKSLFTKDP